MAREREKFVAYGRTWSRPLGDAHSFMAGIRGGKIPIERYVWMLYHGEIPDEYTVIHADGDHRHNDIVNLHLQHTGRHYKMRTAAQMGIIAGEGNAREHEPTRAGPRTKAGLRAISEAAQEMWQKRGTTEQAEIMRANGRTYTKTCVVCGTPFEAHSGNALYCSPRCRYNGLHEERLCRNSECRKPFVTAKDSEREFCSRHCYMVYWQHVRNAYNKINHLKTPEGQVAYANLLARKAQDAERRHWALEVNQRSDDGVAANITEEQATEMREIKRRQDAKFHAMLAREEVERNLPGEAGRLAREKHDREWQEYFDRLKTMPRY